jgi:hypothetical protein
MENVVYILSGHLRRRSTSYRQSPRVANSIARVANPIRTGDGVFIWLRSISWLGRPCSGCLNRLPHSPPVKQEINQDGFVVGVELRRDLFTQTPGNALTHSGGRSPSCNSRITQGFLRRIRNVKCSWQSCGNTCHAEEGAGRQIRGYRMEWLQNQQARI